jgi:predicted transcriptional regulator
MTTRRPKKNQDMVKEDTVAYSVIPMPSDPAVSQGGRPRLFPGPTVRLNLFLPVESAKRVRHLAVEQGLSPSQLVDAWARRAELDWAVERGLEDVAAGRMVDQDEAERRLARWS